LKVIYEYVEEFMSRSTPEMMETSSILHFPLLPLWKGVQEKPGIDQKRPFSLSWDENGFVRQTSKGDVLQGVTGEYVKDQYNFLCSLPGTSSWGDRRGNEFLAVLYDVLSNATNAVVLEIGGGNLHIAENLVRRGNIKAYTAVDPTLTRVGIEDDRISIVPKFFDQNVSGSDDFDFVISMSCLEHVPDPVLFLKTIRKALVRRNGRAVLEFPDAELQFKCGDFNVMLHEHLSYFTPDTVVALFHRCGLEVCGQSRWDDSICFILQPCSTVDTAAQVPIDPMLSGLSSRFDISLNRASRMLMEAHASGVRLAFHGATIGLNNLLSMMEPQWIEKIEIFDGNDAKTGKFLTASPMPIRHTSDSAYQFIDRVLISAATYYEEIHHELMGDIGMGEDMIGSLFPLPETI